MCIICIKKKGIKFPSVENVRNMCDSNPDGFSMVVQSGFDKPEIYKTLNANKFIKRYTDVATNYDPSCTSLYIHARIKTHGTMRIENCHGWKEDGLIFAHNGILSIANRDDLTDSETFFRDIFIPAYELGGWKRGEKTINAIIGSSKFVFMDDHGDIRHYGKYEEEDGILYSNLLFKYNRHGYAAQCGSGWGRYLPYQRTSRCFEKTKSSASDWNRDFMDDDYLF